MVNNDGVFEWQFLDWAEETVRLSIKSWGDSGSFAMGSIWVVWSAWSRADSSNVFP